MVKFTTRATNDQAGFASIVVALVIVIVLSLTTLGFAQLSRREQQSTLFKQLSSQAYYAAESGINDAYEAIQAGEVSEDPLSTKYIEGLSENKCLKGRFTAAGANKIDGPNDVSYTCLMIDLKPSSTQWQGVDDQSSRSLTFKTTGTGTLRQLDVSWGSTTGKNGNRRPDCNPTSATAPVAPPPCTLTPKVLWDSPAVVRFSIVPLNTVTRQAMMDKIFTVYLYPSGNVVGAKTYTAGLASPPYVSGACSTTGDYPCKATITGIDAFATPGSSFLMHVANYYDTSNIVVNNLRDASGPVNFVDGQAVIDATGKAKNVLKRIQIRKPLKDAPILPVDSIEAGSFCKRFNTFPATGGMTGDSQPELDDPSCTVAAP